MSRIAHVSRLIITFIFLGFNILQNNQTLDHIGVRGYQKIWKLSITAVSSSEDGFNQKIISKTADDNYPYRLFPNDA